jgi:hypothetical protein
MLDLTSEQRRLISDKLPDAANIILGAVVLGPFLGQGHFSVARVVGGIALWLSAFGLCFYIGRRT